MIKNSQIKYVEIGNTPNRFQFIKISSHTPKNIQERSAEIIYEDIYILIYNNVATGAYLPYVCLLIVRTPPPLMCNISPLLPYLFKSL